MTSIGEIPISEIFGPTTQCEGKSQGLRVVFVRTGFCNLKCGWCDTKYTWDGDSYDLDKEIHNMTTIDIVTEVKRLAPDVKRVVISGGEPMIHQPELITLLTLFKYEKYLVEIETNGTIELKNRFLELIDQINCSPKTSNSGPDNTPATRDRPEAMKKFVDSEKTNFKFVVGGEGDLPEIEDFILRYGISKDRVYLMPQASTKEEYFRIDESGISFDTRVQRMAIDHGLHFSSRLQIYYWGNERGH
mgnify:CR=1 FL=1